MAEAECLLSVFGVEFDSDDMMSNDWGERIRWNGLQHSFVRYMRIETQKHSDTRAAERSRRVAEGYGQHIQTTTSAPHT